MKINYIVMTLLFSLGRVSAQAGDSAMPSPPEPDPGGRAVQVVDVRSVQDGDTLYLADGRYVRLIGIDTPEFAKTSPKRPWEEEDEPLAREAAEAVAGLLSVPFAHGEPPGDASTDRKARIELDHDLEDDFGRVLGYAWIQRADGAWMMLNHWIIQQGWAYASTHPGTTRHTQVLLVALREAKNEKRGMWASTLPVDVELAWRPEGTRGAGYFHFHDECTSVPRPAAGSPGVLGSWIQAVESGLAPCTQCDYRHRKGAMDREPGK